MPAVIDFDGQAGRYRPERHYMRGAGPATKRSRSQSAG